MFLKQTKCKLCSQNRLSEIIYLKHYENGKISSRMRRQRTIYCARHTVRNIPRVFHSPQMVFRVRFASQFGLLTKPNQNEANKKANSGGLLSNECDECRVSESITGQNTNGIHNQIHIWRFMTFEIGKLHLIEAKRKEPSDGIFFFVVDANPGFMCYGETGSSLLWFFVVFSYIKFVCDRVAILKVSKRNRSE